MWSIQDVAHMAGTTSRTLRHYDAIDLLHPTSIGSNGYRYYDEVALRRLQRILLLRELGLSLPAIKEVLSRHISEREALGTHLELLEQEQDRLSRLINSVKYTLSSLDSRNAQKNTASASPHKTSIGKKGTHMTKNHAEKNNNQNPSTPQKMFDGFDHTQYKKEVEQRWGEDSYAKSDKWYRSLSEERRTAWKEEIAHLNNDWRAAAEDSELRPDSSESQTVAKRHVEWLSQFQKNSHAIPDSAFTAYVRGLAAMYPQDERFAKNYGGALNAEFVRDALLYYMDHREDSSIMTHSFSPSATTVRQ